MSVQEILSDIREHWLIYCSIPLGAAVIGYVTKLLAIRMMFEPIDFVGIKPFLGWQGIVPRNAERMAMIACRTMTTRLISPKDVFGRLDPDAIAREIEKPMLAAVEEVTHEVASQFQAGLWEAMPFKLRNRVISKVKEDSPEIVRRIMQDIHDDIDRMFDLEDLILSALLRDRTLLNRIFRESGHKEFVFIARSGIYFGFAIGIVQTVTWALTHNPWIMPIFGGLTGWFTDWLALRMIFEPKKPTKYFGVFEWQGLFIKRRQEVAADLGRLLATELITPRNVMEALLKGPSSDRLYERVLKHVQDSMDAQAGAAKPLVVFAVGGAKYKSMKEVVARKLMDRLPETLRHAEKYAGDAMDLENTIVAKMQELTEEEFEELLRPAFKQDEWILIAVGAVLGALVGEFQVFAMLHF